VDLARGHRLAAETELPRGARVGEQRDLVARVRGVAHRGIHAHVRHHPGHYQVFDIKPLQLALKGRPPETIWKVLLDNRLAGERLDRLMDLGAFRPWNEERRARPHGKMADVDDGQVPAPEILQYGSRFSSGRVRPLELHRAAGEIVVLQVDDE